MGYLNQFQNDYVCNEVAKGVSHAALTSGKPVIFGVLTTDTIEQAIERAGIKVEMRQLVQLKWKIS